MKYVFGIVGVIIVLLIIVLAIFFGGRNSTEQTAVDKVILSEQTDGNTAVKLTTQGRLVGDTERRAIAVTVTSTQRRLDILSGYDESVISSKTFPNTQEAYETFLVALEEAGFTNQRISLIDDERAACPLGRRFIYQLRENGEDVLRSWDTNCRSDNPGTFDGESNLVRTLFERQIPDYRKETSSVRL